MIRVRSTTGNDSSAGPWHRPRCFSRFALRLWERRQEPSRQQTALDYHINNPAGLRNFLRPLNRLIAIIKRFLPTSVKTNLIFSHDTT